MIEHSPRAQLSPAFASPFVPYVEGLDLRTKSPEYHQAENRAVDRTLHFGHGRVEAAYTETGPDRQLKTPPNDNLSQELYERNTRKLHFAETLAELPAVVALGST